MSALSFLACWEESCLIDALLQTLRYVWFTTCWTGGMVFCGHFQGYAQLWVTSIYVFVIWGEAGGSGTLHYVSYGWYDHGYPGEAALIINTSEELTPTSVIHLEVFRIIWCR